MNALFNPYAAVPSMHVAFALMIGWPLARAGARTAIVSVLWRLYPFLMAFVIVATANHFILDAILGALTAGRLGATGDVARRARPGAGVAGGSAAASHPHGMTRRCSRVYLAPRTHYDAPPRLP